MHSLRFDDMLRMCYFGDMGRLTDGMRLESRPENRRHVHGAFFLLPLALFRLVAPFLVPANQWMAVVFWHSAHRAYIAGLR